MQLKYEVVVSSKRGWPKTGGFDAVSSAEALTQLMKIGKRRGEGRVCFEEAVSLRHTSARGGLADVNSL